MSKYTAALVASGFTIEKVGSAAQSVEVLTRPLSPGVATTVRALESLPAPPPSRPAKTQENK